MSPLAKVEPLRAFVSLFYPPLCVSCSADVSYGEYLCFDCEKKALRIKAPFCDKCSEQFEGAISGNFSCANCVHRRLYFEAAVSCYRSRGIVRHLVHQFKYGRRFHLRHPLGDWLGETL